jgi:hypothetical protein
MAKELRTAEELSDMIVSSLGARETEIQIRKDHAYGWQPTVVACPGDLIGYQRRVEEIANRLRVQRPPGMTSGVAISHWPANHAACVHRDRS